MDAVTLSLAYYVGLIIPFKERILDWPNNEQFLQYVNVQ